MALRDFAYTTAALTPDPQRPSANAAGTLVGLLRQQWVLAGMIRRLIPGVRLQQVAIREVLHGTGDHASSAAVGTVDPGRREEARGKTTSGIRGMRVRHWT